jgi:catechol 1,2-dioxygenase
MIIKTEKDLTKAVLAEIAKAPNPRFREIMSAFVRHLHDFAREVKLTEEEFREAMAHVVKVGKASNGPNEAVLISGSLGFSQLIVMLNNGDNGGDTDASLLGPFWRMHSPVTPNGGSIVRSPTPGEAFVNAWFKDRRQADRRRRGRRVALLDRASRTRTGAADRSARQVRPMPTVISFRSIKPPAIDPDRWADRDLLRAQGRHNMRPAHLHFLASRTVQDTDLADLRAGRQFLETDAVWRHPPTDRQLCAA